jgi:lipoyl(octanoyl) transferase
MALLTDPLWRPITGLSEYAKTVAAMETHVERMANGSASEEIWLVEHPPLLTSGTSADPADLLLPERFPVHASGRGGRFTYHGPGQRIVYPMLDLGMRGRDVRRYVSALEAWAIAALADCGIEAGISDAGTGIWVATGNGLRKIGAIGVRVRRWISFHGLALNVTTDLEHYAAIVPCGISEFGVTRAADLAPGLSMDRLDEALLLNLPVLMHSLSAAEPPCIKTLEAHRD